MAGAKRRLKPQTHDLSAPAEAQLVSDACESLWRSAPHLSAKRVLTGVQALWLASAAGFLIAFGLWSPSAGLTVLKIVALAVFIGAVIVRACAAGAMLSPRSPPTRRWTGPLPRYTILCPMRREPESVAGLVRALRNLAYPRALLDIKLVLEADDIETIAAARAVAADFHIVETPPCAPRTKPKALNYAMAFAAGDFVCVYDAEDRPHPQQLRAALDAFANEGDGTLGVVQAPLLIDNGARHWIARQFEAEYAAHFLGVMPLLARLNLHPPLGGTSNHFRRAALEDAGLWDPYNVTEDADLGFRLASRGWRIGVITPPTFEEAPVSMRAWIVQRSRWIKGYMQTWLVLMRRPVTAWRTLGPWGFATMQITLLGSILAVLAHAPACFILLLALAHGHRLSSIDLALAIAGYATGLMSVISAAAVRGSPRLLLAALTLPIYWPLGSIAGLRALRDLIVRPHHWSKTDHGRSKRETPVVWD